MTRRRAALLAAVLAVLLGATYLLSRRTPVAAPELVPTPLETRPVPPSPRETAEAAATVEASDVPTAELTAPRKTAEPRSWGGSRAVPARTPPSVASELVAPTTDGTEEPLPTWVRVGIVAAALIAFFAVSLIATKQV